MKHKLWAAVLAAASLLLLARPIYAQQLFPAEKKLSDTGSIVGMLKDPSGAVVAGAKVDIRNPSSEFQKTLFTDRQGSYYLTALPPGRYQIAITSAGFTPALIRDLSVEAGHEAAANLTLNIAPVTTAVEVNGQVIDSIAAISKKWTQATWDAVVTQRRSLKMCRA